MVDSWRVASLRIIDRSVQMLVSNPLHKNESFTTTLL